MPQWLNNQLMRAFYKKDRRQIKLLNDCWFFYHKAPGVEFDANNG
ncbi:cortex morphogenetic protein CmpA [Paenibacillus sp. NPDC055715]